MEKLLRGFAAKLVWALAILFALAVCFGFGSDSLYWRIVPASALGAVLVTAVYFSARRAKQFTLPPLPAASLFACILIGLALRIGVAIAVHPTEVSDMASYDYSARHLLAAHEYICKEGSYILHAYRPPGVAFLLAGTMALTGGPHSWTPLLLNCIFFTGSSLLLWFALRHWSQSLAFAVVALFAIWPSEIAIASLTQSETPTILVSAAMIFILFRVRGLWTTALSLGLVTGISCLVRNSNLVMAGVWIFVLLLKPAPFPKRLAACAVLILCCFAPIVPWTIRNYEIFHQPVLVATNGGENIWSANNPWTNGSYDDQSLKLDRVYLPDEIAMDKAGFAFAKQWIRAHPTAFVGLSINKIRILLGSDGWGWYYALERGTGYTGPWYRALSLAGDFWWLAVWLVIFRGLLRHPRVFEQNLPLLAVAAFTLGSALLFFIFQSQPRYHAYMIPGLLCLLGTNLEPVPERA
jgi:hypothetical protein